MEQIPDEGVVEGWQILSIDVDEPVPFEYEELVNYVWDRLRCPVSVEPIYGDWGPRLLLFALWREHLADYEVDNESGLLDFFDGGDESDVVPPFLREGMNSESPLFLDEPRALAINISTWIAKARFDFLESTRLLRAVVAGPATYPKHFPPPSCSTFEDLRNASFKGVAGKPASRLLYNIHYPHIHHLVSTVQVNFFHRLVQTDNFRGAVDCLGAVGVVEGVLTDYLAIEWSAATIHAYPVSQSEAKAIGKLSLTASIDEGATGDEMVLRFPEDGIVCYDGLQGQGTLSKPDPS